MTDNSGAAAVQIDDHLIAAGEVSVQGAAVSLAAGKAIDTRAVSGGRAGSAVTIDAGAGGIALDGNVLVDDAAVTLRSQGNLTQANAAAIASGSGAVTATSGGTTKLSRVQTTGLLTATGQRVVLDAGTTDTAIQAGTLQLQATGTDAQALDVRSSVKLAAGNSSITSANDLVMQPDTLIEIGASGRLTIDAAQSVSMEHLKSAGAGVLIRSAHGDVIFNKDLGGRAPGDSATVVTLGGDTVPEPTLYALDVRAPEGKIETQGLLLYGLKGAPLTIELPPLGDLAYGLNLQASQVFVRKLVFVLDGAMNIEGSSKVVIGNSIRSANGFAMSIGGGEIDLYRPTRPDGTEYRNTDIIVAQYPDNTLRFFEQLNGVWQQSTSFLSVVMPADLPAPGAIDPVTTLPIPLPGFWLDRTLANPGLAGDAAFAVGGQAPTRLLSLPNNTPSSSNGFTPASRLASFDPTGQGRNPFVPLIYSPDSGPPDAGSEVTVIPIANQFTVPKPAGIGDIPGTRFIPKILVTNDPGPAFSPGAVAVNGVATTDIGRLTLIGAVYESDTQGRRLVRDTAGGFASAGDLRNVSLKVVSFDTRSLFQDSRIAPFGIGGTATVLGVCSLTPGTCLDDPAYVRPTPGVGPFNDYPRIVYGDSLMQPRVLGPTVGPDVFNPVSVGFQAAGYLSRNCSGAACERPVVPAPTDPLRPAYFAGGEQPSAGANPNALTSSLTWLNAQPELTSLGRFEFLQTGGLTTFGNPTLIPRDGIGGASSVLGLSNVGQGDVYKIGAGLTQTPVKATGDPMTPTRIVLAVNNGIIVGQGITMSTDGTTAFKTSLPTPSIATAGNGAAPTFTTITPTLLSVSSSASNISAAGGLPAAQIGTVPLQPPVTAPPQGDNSGAALIDALGTGLAANVANALQNDAETASQATPDAPRPEIGTTVVLGGRGLAQSVDLGRSGGLGRVLSGGAGVDYEVACAVDESPERDRGVALQSSRRGAVLRPCR